MGFDIPEPFCWDDSFKVFYENLDEQHKGLFQGIFDVAGDKASAGKLKGLQDRVSAHFKAEEEMMGKVGFDGLASHKQAHDEFVAKLSAVKTPVSDDVILFAKDWLVNHIKGIDFKYKGKL